MAITPTAMILRTCLRQKSALSSAVRPSITKSPLRASIPQCQARFKHSLPHMGKNDEDFKQEGIQGFLTPEAYNVAWTDYQTHLITTLNTTLAESPMKDWDPKTLLLNTARDPAQAMLFNYASMAHNNHFFFSSLSKDLTHMPEDLQRHLITSFGSLDTFRTTLIATAAASFGPSFTWLVQVQNPSPNHPSVSSSSASAYARGNASNQQLHFRLMTTYLAGSPYPGAHHRAQTTDMNTQNLTSATIARQAAAAGPTPANAEDARRQSTIQNTAGGFGDYGARGGRNDAMRFGGADVVPVLCVSNWEHVYMWDWGVSGKRAYLAKWYERIDWEVVWGRCEVGASGGAGGRGGYQF